MTRHIGLRHFNRASTNGQIMGQRMYGVVLWADARDSKAVIWCEDHGNLAYYAPAEQNAHQGVEVDAGDLIQFDLRENAELRMASNLERVDCGFAPGLASKLRSTFGAPEGANHDNIVELRRRA